MYTLYKFHFLNGISEINQLFDDILIIWPAPVYIVVVSRLDQKMPGPIFCSSPADSPCTCVKKREIYLFFFLLKKNKLHFLSHLKLCII